MKTFLVMAALAVSAAAFSASGASAAGYLKYGDIKGEATEARQHKPVVVKKDGAQDQEMISHKHGSDQVQHNTDDTKAPFVAAGDVTGDGVDSPEKGHARVRGGLNPADEVEAQQDEQKIEKGHARVRGGLNPADTVKAPDDDFEHRPAFAGRSEITPPPADGRSCAQDRPFACGHDILAFAFYIGGMIRTSPL